MRRGLVLLMLLLAATPVQAASDGASPADSAATPPAGVAAGTGPDGVPSPGGPPPLDINRAGAAEIRALPIPREVADALIDHRDYQALYTSVFDLAQVKGMTPELLRRLRPLVVITPVFESARIEQEDAAIRAGDLNYLVQRLLSEEGASEGLVDDYVDQIKEPRNVNRLDYFDLLGYQNVSPVDAVAILKERAATGRIENARQLRAASGISYWGFRNLRDFVRYDDPPLAWGQPSADYQFRVYNTPYQLDDADILNENIIGDTNGLTAEQKENFRNYDLNTYAGRLGLIGTDPYLTHKVRARDGLYLKAGYLSHRNLGEARWNEGAKGFLSLADLPARDTPLGPLRLHALVLGDYTVAFGQGLVMDATDFFMARRTGYGYSVRAIGLRGDLSRSEEFGLRGVAGEWSLGRVRATSFLSRTDKDAILNPDGSFHAYIRMVPRLSDDLLAGIREDIASGVFAGRGDTSAFLPMRHVMDERVLGTNVRVEIAPGTWAGVTGMEIRTRNRLFDSPIAQRWNPDPTLLVIDPGRLEDRDAEIGAGYDSRAIGDYRRIWGAEAQTVWRNLAVAAEYAKLDTLPTHALVPLFAKGAQAFVGHAYLQYENFNVLALYRDYGLAYDNPYDRAFSEDSRFEQTILDGNAYRLRNPYWAELARFIPQPKAERGWYFNARYQLTRQLTITGLEYDAWSRKADGADLDRFALRAEYRPIFPLRLRVRHAISSRHADRADDVRAYRSWDTRLELLANLSAFDQLRFLYSTSNVRFAARGRLSGPAGGGDVQDDTTAVRGSPARAVQGVLTHNFSPWLALTLSSEIYDGFLYNYEDNEFVVVDGKGFRSWVLLASRLSDRLSWRFKWTTDHSLSRTYVDIRNYGSLLSPTPDAVDARGDRSAFRLQLDCSL
jgi:DNA uptake protein ComE-like DNA-binding protein